MRMLTELIIVLSLLLFKEGKLSKALPLADKKKWETTAH